MRAGIEYEAKSARPWRSSAAFLNALDAETLAALEGELERIGLPGGETLFRENEVADALYIVATGSLAVSVQATDGRDTRVARIQAGETVGEMALLAGGFRSATVVALRDTELLRLGRASFERLVQRHPASMLPLVSLLATRLRAMTHRAEPGAPIRTLGVIPMGLDADHESVAHALRDHLAKDGRRIMLLDSGSAAFTSEWFNAAEKASELVVYCGEARDSAWTKLCMRQADRVLLVASTDRPLTRPPWLPEDRKNWHQAFDLVLLHDGCQWASKISQNWHERLPLDLICHIRRGNIDDLARLARLSTGQAVGLVLSSGGARGFAHLGIVRALREADIPIDLIGGCSMGAIVGAAVALEWDDGETRERLHQAFVESKPINDYTLPFVALTKGRKVDQRLEQHFGSTRIEDLWRPFFCVSTNLTTGTLAVHRSGTLATALRASISIPGLLPPVMIAGDAHVDGGIMNYLPVDVMSRKRGPVIAVDVGSVPVSKPVGDGSRMRSICQFLRLGRRIPPIVDILVRAATVNGDSRAKAMRAQADRLFEPPLDNVDLLDWRACDRTIEAGYRYAIETLEHCDKSTLRGSW
jgi:NTE family protein